MRIVDINEFLDELDSEQRGIVNALRGVIRRTVPEAEETIVWGCLSYHRPQVGGRVKGAVCQIVVKRGVVRLDFIHGIRLSDPSALLRGELVSKRYVEIASIADAERPELAALIEEAGTLAPDSWETTDGDHDSV